MTMTTFEPGDNEDQRQWRRRKSDQPQPLKFVAFVTLALSLLGLVFTAGYNWRSVAILEQHQEDFVRKDVQQYQFQNINDQLSEIRRQQEVNQRQTEDIRADLKHLTTR